MWFQASIIIGVLALSVMNGQAQSASPTPTTGDTQGAANVGKDQLVPLFRMREEDGRRMITTDCNERVSLSNAHYWFDEGVMGYAPSTYTTSDLENILRWRKGNRYEWDVADPIISEFRREHGWIREGLLFHLYRERREGMLPFHILSGNGDTFYTTSQAEADNGRLHGGYTSDKVYGYVYDIHLDFCPIPSEQPGPGFGNINFDNITKSFRERIGKFVGKTWEHIKNDTGPAINQWVIHLGFKCDQGQNCKVNADSFQRGPQPPKGANPDKLALGPWPCRGPDDQIYTPGSTFNGFLDGRHDYVCSGINDGTGNGEWRGYN